MAFKVGKAVREKVYTKIALMAPSGGGKTYSALRLATGMAEELEKVTGKKTKILMANTESFRGRYYANEFDYDIIDLTPPYIPEQFVEAIDFAVSEGYDILIMDSTSHEWEGKGGCLELHQKAGGKYQDWKYVTPRHDAFINKLASSPIHIIATMRGKDQYEMERDDKGRTTVKKIGLGAKQRDGFEFEFTSTFTIDSKSHTAEVQKDNTHIFENDAAVVLTEDHGRKIIKWANDSDIAPVAPVPTPVPAAVEDTDNLAAMRKEIMALANEIYKTNKNVMQVVKKYAPNGNPNTIVSESVACQLLAELKEM